MPIALYRAEQLLLALLLCPPSHFGPLAFLTAGMGGKGFSEQLSTQLPTLEWAYHDRWEEDFMILVHEPEAEQLTVVLFHRSAFGPADEIGRCQVRLQSLHTGWN